MRPVVVGTAGHVDHGKSTLVRALTGTDPDRLAEEKARGMTIDLGFAVLDLPGGIRAGLVDVPGHERFVKNMLAGTGGVDVALLVVAADEGPMPQTREHIDILRLLGVSRGVVALSRADLADPEIAAVAADETRSLLAGTPLAGSPIVPVSAVTRAGLPELVDALATAAAASPVRPETGPARLPVDRAFTLPGVGTVVTGTLVRGTLRAGDPLEVQPAGIATKARTLQAHGERVAEACAGSRVAVNLPGVELEQVARGAVLCTPGSLAPTRTLDVRIDLLASAPRPLRHRDRVRVHLGTGEIPARVHLLGTDALEPGAEGASAQLLLEADAAPARGERFVVRSWSPQRAIAGGIVLDPAPARRWRRTDAEARDRLAAMADTGSVDAVHGALAAKTIDFTEEEVASAAGIGRDAAAGALAELAGHGRAVRLPDGRWISDRTADRVRDSAKRLLGEHHRKHPLRRTLPREALRVPIAKAAQVRDYAALVQWLIDDGVVAAEPGGGIRLPEHAVVLPAPWRKAADEIAAVYDAAGFQPPYPNAFVYPRDIPVGALLGVLADEGRVARFGDDLWMGIAAYRTAVDAVRRLAGTEEGITVGSLRDATGSSRKIILPLLEHFDAIRLTRRIGDNRRVLAEAGQADVQSG